MHLTDKRGDLSDEVRELDEKGDRRMIIREEGWIARKIRVETRLITNLETLQKVIYGKGPEGRTKENALNAVIYDAIQLIEMDRDYLCDSLGCRTETE